MTSPRDTLEAIAWLQRLRADLKLLWAIPDARRHVRFGVIVIQRMLDSFEDDWTIAGPSMFGHLADLQMWAEQLETEFLIGGA